MPIRNDEDLKRYLRQFQPRAAQPLPLPKRVGALARWWVWAAPATAALIAVVVWVVTIHLRPKPAVPLGASNAPGLAQVTNVQPLTFGRSNHLLARSDSFKAALDSMAFERQRRPLEKGTQSALATLGKEDFKQ